MPKMLDDIGIMLSGEISPPIATWPGFTLMSAEPGEAVIAFEAAVSRGNGRRRRER